jgi:hypothetical protein
MRNMTLFIAFLDSSRSFELFCTVNLSKMKKGGRGDVSSCHI